MDDPPETHQAEDSIEPSNRSLTANRTDSDGEPDRSASTRTEQSAVDRGPTAVDSDGSVIDSNWWYWVAAMPLYAGIGMVVGIIVAVLFFFSVIVDIGGGAGIATGIVGLLVFSAGFVYVIAGLILSVMSPIGIYMDAKEIEESSVPWDPDPILYLVVSAGAVIFTGAMLNVVIALYYLYRRHEEIGVP